MECPKGWIGLYWAGTVVHYKISIWNTHTYAVEITHHITITLFIATRIVQPTLCIPQIPVSISTKLRMGNLEKVAMAQSYCQIWRARIYNCSTVRSALRQSSLPYAKSDDHPAWLWSTAIWPGMHTSISQFALRDGLQFSQNYLIVCYLRPAKLQEGEITSESS